jgi:hypothetical protein
MGRADQSWEYINGSKIHECRNWEQGHTFLFLGILNLGFRYSVGKMLGLEKQSNYLLINMLYLLLAEHKLAQRREGVFVLNNN